MVLSIIRNQSKTKTIGTLFLIHSLTAILDMFLRHSLTTILDTKLKRFYGGFFGLELLEISQELFFKQIIIRI